MASRLVECPRSIQQFHAQGLPAVQLYRSATSTRLPLVRIAALTLFQVMSRCSVTLAIVGVTEHHRDQPTPVSPVPLQTRL